MSDDTPLALDKALAYLTKADRTEVEIRNRLGRLRFDEETVEETVRKLRVLGYLDDTRVARREVDLLAPAKGLGKRRIEQRLLSRGVEEELAEVEVGRIGEETELEKALGLLKKKYRADDDFAKAGRFLMQRGFDEEIVRTALGQHFPAFEE